MSRQQVNVRLPSISIGQIESIAETHGLTKTQVLILAIDRLYVGLEGSGPHQKSALRRLLKDARKDDAEE